MLAVIKYSYQSHLLVRMTMNVLQLKHVEMAIVSILVLLISHAYNLLHAVSPITEQDVNAHQDMKAMVSSHAQKFGKESVDMTWIALTTELVFNINVLILVSYWIPVVRELFVKPHHTDQYAAVHLDGEEIRTSSVINMNVK